MTITLKPKQERELREAAARRNMTVDELVEERLQGGPAPELLPEPSESAEQAALRARMKAARGKFTHISGGSYAFMRNKVYEKLLEERPR